MIIVFSFQASLFYFVSKKLYYIKYEFRRIFSYFLVAGAFYGISTQMQMDMLFVSLGIKIFLLILFPFAIILLKIVTPGEKAKIKKIYTEIKPRILSKFALKTT